MAENPKKTRPSISIPLSDEAKTALEAVAARTRRSQTQTLSAILEWIKSQPDEVIDAIVSGRDAAAALIRLRGDELAEPESLDGAKAAADQAIERLARIARESQHAAKAAMKSKK